MLRIFTDKRDIYRKRTDIYLFALLIGLSVFLSGCTTTPTGVTTQILLATDTPVSKVPTEQATQGFILPTPTTRETREAELTSTPPVIPPCVTVYYEGYAQVEMKSPRGVRVLVDVYDPGLLSATVLEEDILLTTHTHFDHVNSDFLASFPGMQLKTQEGRVEAEDVIIQGIPSAHNVGDSLVSEGATNYIYTLDMNGIRIAHFGDIGQEALTDEQLDLLGKVDIAVTQLANPYSDMSAENQKGIKLMEQARPKLIIPTHVNLDVLKLAAERWDGIYSENPSVTICITDLPDKTSLLLMGEAAARFAERQSFERVDW